MRICLVYDCLFPHTVGGAERWYRNLAERLAADGHEVTYLTLRQWDRGADPGVPGVDVVAVGPRMELYTESGPAPDPAPARVRRRRALAPAPSRPAATTPSTPRRSRTSRCSRRPRRAGRAASGWSSTGTRCGRADYWREYLGPAGGPSAGWSSGSALRVRQRAFCFSRLHARRLRDEGCRGEVDRARGRVRRAARGRVATARGRAAGRVRRTHHPGEAGARDRRRRSRGRASALPELRAEHLRRRPRRGRVVERRSPSSGSPM